MGLSDAGGWGKDSSPHAEAEIPRCCDTVIDGAAQTELAANSNLLPLVNAVVGRSCG